jgi:Tfp pilus assembly protein FimV
VPIFPDRDISPKVRGKFRRNIYHSATKHPTVKLKPVVLLLGLYFSAPVYAIGLGDLAVRSHLGQPLHATVEILSAPPTLAADCLSLRASDSGLAAPSQARFRIERRGENALLHITTPKAVNDPIAQFVLVSDCEGRLQREYVVLLDPPAVIAPAAIAPVALAEPQAGTVSTPTSLPPAPAATPPAPPAMAKTAKPATATATSAAAAKPSRPTQRKLVAQTATPRLVISGKDTLPEAGRLPAGLEKEAPPKSSNTRTSELSATELSDENTALNRRLAYLEAQLAALHKRNEELEARRAAAEASAPKPVADQPPQWPLYLLGLGLLASGGLLASWLTRRRSLPRSEVAATVLWARPNNAIATKAGVDLDAPLPRLEPMLASDSLPQNPPAPH